MNRNYTRLTRFWDEEWKKSLHMLVRVSSIYFRLYAFVQKALKTISTEVNKNKATQMKTSVNSRKGRPMDSKTQGKLKRYFGQPNSWVHSNSKGVPWKASKGNTSLFYHYKMAQIPPNSRRSFLQGWKRSPLAKNEKEIEQDRCSITFLRCLGRMLLLKQGCFM